MILGMKYRPGRTRKCNQTPWYHFLLIHLGMATCAFENDIAKLTLEIADPRMLEVVKDKRVTFADMLGTVGAAM